MKSFYRSLETLLVLLLCTVAAQATSITNPTPTPPVKPAKLGLCVGCHGENGKAALPAYPHLAGQNRDYLINALRAYQSGARTSAEMKVSTGTLKPSDIVELAAWYSWQKP
jgi:cytochrome c553